MGLQTPNEFQMTPCKCHICYEDIREDQHAIEHAGEGQLSQTKDPRIQEILKEAWVDGFTTLWFHPECATVMALRLAHDVMKIKNVKDQPRRVVDGLQDLAKVNQVK
jgi:hypothetical protein